MARRLLILGLVLAASAAAAQPAGQSLRAAQTEQQLKAQRAARSGDEAQRLRAEIEALSEQLSRLAAQQSRGGDEVAAARARLEALNVRDAAMLSRVGASEARLARLLGALQMYGKRPPPALLVHPDDAKKAVRAAILIRAVTPALQAETRALASEAAKAQAGRRTAAAASEGLFLTESQFAERAAEIEALIARKARAEAELSAGARADSRDVAALAARIQNLRGQTPAGAPPPSAAGGFRPPVEPPPALRFGAAARRGGRLQGWLWRLSGGEAVRAPAAGLVEYAGALADWDNVIILNVGDDRRLVLAGVGPLRVQQGVAVEAGALLAQMPPRSARDEPELYMEVRKSGEPLDPARFFAAIAP